MTDRPLPLTVFHEIIFQRYMFSLLHNRTSKHYKKLKKLSNFPSDFNLVVPEVYFWNDTESGRKKVISYKTETKSLKMYKADFVIYPTEDEIGKLVKRKESLYGEGRFLEVKITLDHTFELHQWAALFYKGHSIVASLTKINDDDWELLCNQKIGEIVKKYPELANEEWIKKPQGRIEHYQIDKSDFSEWYIKNAGLMLEDQLHDSKKPRYWLCVLSSKAMKNWNRMRNEYGEKKRFWAWQHSPNGHALNSLMRIRGGDYIIFTSAHQAPHPNHPKTLRWSYNFKPGVKATEKQMHNMEIVLKSAFIVKAKSNSSVKKNYSAYHVKLGNDKEATFFEKCSHRECKTPGCQGCNDGKLKPMNSITWPHYLSFEELNEIHCKKNTNIIRGTIGERWTQAGLEKRGNPPVEITHDEFIQLKAVCYANENRTNSSRISRNNEIQDTIQELKDIAKKLS
jgi:hypothetical protein